MKEAFNIVLFILCITSVLSAKMTEEQKKQMQPHRDACYAETGVMEADVNDAEMKRQYPSDGKLDCFAACMFKRLEVMSKEGELDEDMARAILSQNIREDKLDDVMNDCTSKVGKDTCETAGMLFNCFMKYEDEMM